ncbi:TPA: NAD-dependent epimerase [Staphylococcus pseudintermedius]|uniref:NAD-dependent epimerase n=1 Tax=Staphylococcus pseudintermedius TaxID=283734 RepID=UPI000C70E9A6|nr:NAD-dependent epimerase [Staphylococcus pseudintermedius]EGQ0374036.1 NAD-dependent epimerase [Staphylococcus pseudintermedius]EGQ2886758.1 NAD-dependent epimerase [Staphylococcus pseudintermedius]EGQ3223215.1 NAD-dependent epimerase [Staphylococcus pseudintermedius]EGQ3280414.1 NAD-dependent epimerase [Staphylococcus pseudintermedius]EGQ3719206.1 NAD-dependent epimerase [Staphylococcus pseudintermedius]
MKILITGVAGFIGSHLAKKLIAKDHEIIGVDNINDYYDPKLKEDRLKSIGDKNFKFYKTDIEDDQKLSEIFEEHHPSVVVNLAAQAGVRYSLENPRAYIDSNIIGFMNILECARHYHIDNLIYASSSSVYGANTSKPFSTSDNIDHPLSLYAATKKSNELMAHTYSHLYNIPTTGLRFFTVYGPWGRPDMALFKFTDAIVHDRPIDVYNHGQMMRDFTYVDDIVEAMSRLIKRPAQPNNEWDGAKPDPGSSYAPYKIYNIGNNSPVRLMAFVEAIENKLAKTAQKNFMELQPGDVPETYANVDDLYRDINFKPETSIQEGVNQFIDWYLDYYDK